MKFRWWRTSLTALLALSLLMAVSACYLNWRYPLAPVLRDFEQRYYSQVVYDSDKQPLWAFAGEDGYWRYPVALSQVSPLYLQALVNYEDRYFYYHFGVNPIAIARAAWQNWRCGCVVSGASTLTMQVARLYFPHRKDLFGKVSQVLRALQLEWHLTKAEILTLYVNAAPFGGTLYGVEAASQNYFAKAAAQLTYNEAALLAVLPQAPSRYRPDRYPDAAKFARNKVLARLQSQGLWLDANIDRLQARPVYGQAPKPLQSAAIFSRFVANAQPKLKRIGTTINGPWQRDVEALLLDSKSLWQQGSSAAVLVIDNGSADVKVYAGSADFWDESRFGQVDMVQALRSPGSTLKPFIYGLAIDRGLIHPQSLLSDVPRFAGQYRPENFSKGFSGPVSVADALVRSLNMPAVQVLEALSPQYFNDRLAASGLQLVLPTGATPNLSLALGGAGVNLWQLAQSYRALATAGQVATLNWADAETQTRIAELASLSNLAQRQSGTSTHLSTAGFRPMLSEDAAFLVFDMLSRNHALDEVQHPLLARQQQQLAFKTGTSYGFRDAWAVGVTPDYTVAVWLGRPDNSASAGQYAAISAVPLMKQVLARLPRLASTLTPPAGVTWQSSCWPLGLAKSQTAPAACLKELTGWTLARQVPPTLKAVEQPLANDLTMTIWRGASGDIVTSDCDALPVSSEPLVFWPAQLEPWLPVTWRRASLLGKMDASCRKPLLAMGEALIIAGLPEQAVFARPSGGELPLTLQLKGASGNVAWFLNGDAVAVLPATQSLRLHFTAPGEQQLIAVAEQGQSVLRQFYVR